MILITGFVPFISKQGVVLDHNPTADIATNVGQRYEWLRSATLPVSYRQTKKELSELLKTIQPSFLIALGFAPHRSSVDFERVALNLEASERPDNDGYVAGGQRIMADGPLAYESTVEVGVPMEALRASGVDVRCSFHAGTFLCNQTFYVGCHLIGADRTSFVHVPPNIPLNLFTQALVDWCRILHQSIPRPDGLSVRD